MGGYRDNQRAALHPDEDFARGILKSALVPGESIVWADRPKRGFIYEPNPHLFVNLVWTLVSLVWVCCGVLTDVSLALGLLAIPLVLIGLHGLIGHYLSDAWQRRVEVYGLTNRRLLIATPSRVVRAMWLGELRTHLVKNLGQREDGVGHIRVVSPRCELRAVPNAEAVHRLIVETQAAAPVSASPESAPASAIPESATPESAEGSRSALR